MDGFQLSGIDKQFRAHSTRAAAASKAAVDVDINTVLSTVGWKSAGTFAKFYHKPIFSNSSSFGNAVLSE